MDMRRVRTILLLALCAILAASLVSCNSPSVSTMDSNKINAYGSDFISDLNNGIIAYRENPELLIYLDLVLVESDKTYNASKLYDFYRDYEAGESCALTLVFSGNSFVVVRLVHDGPDGYYFRYEYDRFHDDEVIVQSQPVDGFRVEEDDYIGKVEVQVMKGKESEYTFTLRNLQPEEDI